MVQLDHGYIYTTLFLILSELASFGDDSTAAMNAFREKCSILKKAGVLVLRGHREATCVADLQPVSPMKWRVITWEPGSKPSSRGYYSVPNFLKQEHAERCEEVVTDFCLTYLQKNSEEDEDKDTDTD